MGMTRLNRGLGFAFSLGLLTVLGGCETEDVAAPGADFIGEPNAVWWGLGWCPECAKRDPMDTEQVRIDMAFQKVDSNCVDQALGSGAYDWLDMQVYSGLGIDLDVMTLAEYDYARGYWVPPSLRYQYWGKPIWVAQQHVSESELRDIAVTLVHEAAHEFGYAGQDEEGIAETLGWLCTN